MTKQEHITPMTAEDERKAIVAYLKTPVTVKKWFAVFGWSFGAWLWFPLNKAMQPSIDEIANAIENKAHHKETP